MFQLKKWFGIVFALNNNKHINQNAMKHIYLEKIELGVYYTYNNKQKKVYDLKSIKKDFKSLIKKLTKYD
tara:strand:- start:857 stop:1066 length:210 start_codon:yes stop_codon:yes gene_type:complete